MAAKYTAILDACVLYPYFIRDVLLSVACEGVYIPKWSNKIQEEWVSNLEKNRPDIPKNNILELVEIMSKRFPECLIDDFEDIIPSLSLPDENDRHVLAAAIKSGADAIITSNLKDFPTKEIFNKYHIEIIDPDTFLLIQYDLSPPSFLNAIKKMRERYRNPPKTAQELIFLFENSNLVQTANFLKNNTLHLI